MKKGFFLVWTLLACFAMGRICHGEQTLIAQKVDRPPALDGVADDSVWQSAGSVVTRDRIADLEITLKAVYTDDRIFFLVVFPDPDESGIHKAWIWDKKSESYKIGPEREDGFIFKWNIKSPRTDLSVYADAPYVADIWFWKAGRTDPMGFADDKIQTLGTTKRDRSKKLVSKSGKTTYLQRAGDKGASAYRNVIYIDYEGDRKPQYTHQLPGRSRADIRAKGIWADGEWTIEFGRKLNTGHEDDVQFMVGKVYQFGVSRYEIAGRQPDPAVSQPLYGAGDVSENLFLKFRQESPESEVPGE